MKKEVRIGDKGYFITIGNVPIEIEVTGFHKEGFWVKTQYGEAPMMPQAIVWDKAQVYQMCVGYVQADIEDYEDEIRACRHKLERLKAWYEDKPLYGRKVVFGEQIVNKS